MKHLVFLKKFAALVLLFFILDFLISIILINGLDKYYGFSKQANVLISGSSMAMSGFNREEIENLTNMKIATYTHEGVSVDERLAMIDHFFLEYPNSVKTVVYEVNPYIFSGSRTSENVYTIFYPYMDNKTIDKFVKERAPLKDYYLNKIIRTKRFDSRLMRLVFIGYLGKYDNLKTGVVDSAMLVPLIAQKGTRPVRMNPVKKDVFENTMDLIRANNANIILVMMPMYYAKLETFDENGFQNLCKYFETYSLTTEHVRFINLNSESMIKNRQYYSDPLHFNVFGQKQITGLISSYIVEN